MPTPELKTPGQLVRLLLEERGWNQRTLSIVLNCSDAAINMILADKRDMSAELALKLSVIFDVEPERFLDLQKSWELARARFVTSHDEKLARRAALFAMLPIGDMIKRRWIRATNVKAIDEVEQALTAFFGVRSIEELPVLPHAAKKTDALSPATPVQLAWLHRCRQIAREMVPTGRFSPSAGKHAVERLAELLASAEEARHVPRILSEAGIRFVIVEALPKAKIDGACFWLDDRSPVIAISLRHDRIDNFWFVLRHELEHVLRGHGKGVPLIDTDVELAPTPVTLEEYEANEAASYFCVPPREIESFIARKQPFFADRDIIGFAGRLKLHPGIVAGQLRYRLGLWDRFSKHLVKMRQTVSQGAMVDGWGDVAPIEQ